jgi:alpha,alpha-trehalase
MAVWTLQTGLKILDLLAPDRRQHLRRTLDLRDEELARWHDMTRRMHLVVHGDGIISQFEGYEDLEEFNWEGYRQKYRDIQRLDRVLEAEQDTPNRHKVSKQADVLMLFYFFSADELRAVFEQLSYPFTYKTILRNVGYYLRRTSHGSTLSRIVHSWGLARSDRTHSWRLCTEALESDIRDTQGGTTPEGIHLGAMVGSVDLVQRCYCGIEMRDEVLWRHPCLPADVRRLELQIRYCSHWLTVEVSHEALRVTSRQGWAKTARVGFRNQVYEFEAGDVREFVL